MGLKLFGSDTKPYQSYSNTTPNPNKFVFDIRHEEKIGNYLIAYVHYPHAPAYGGNKVLVYEGVDSIKDLEVLDPHFLEDNNPNPIARFRGNLAGLTLARQFVNSIGK